MIYRVLGIDPGKTGYAAEGLYDPGRQRWELGATFPLKTCWETSSVTGKPDLLAFQGWLYPRTTSREHGFDLIVLEDVFARKGDGAVQAFSFGGAAMLVDMSLHAAGLLHIVQYVNPATWKANMGLAEGGTKNEKKTRSRQMARSIFGDTADGEKFKSHDKAEAALLAYYGRRFLLA